MLTNTSLGAFYLFTFPFYQIYWGDWLTKLYRFHVQNSATHNPYTVSPHQDLVHHLSTHTILHLPSAIPTPSSHHAVEHVCELSLSLSFVFCPIPPSPSTHPRSPTAVSLLALYPWVCLYFPWNILNTESICFVLGLWPCTFNKLPGRFPVHSRGWERLPSICGKHIKRQIIILYFKTCSSFGIFTSRPPNTISLRWQCNLMRMQFFYKVEQSGFNQELYLGGCFSP